MNTEPLLLLRNYRWLGTMNTEIFAVLRNYRWLRTMDTKPSDVLRNYEWLIVHFKKEEGWLFFQITL
jgi:hypothetical protein